MRFGKRHYGFGRCPGDLRPRGGFTILELLAVFVIIGVLVSLLCAALNHTRYKAQRIKCLDNLKQLQLAWLMYKDDNDDRLALNKTAPAPNHPRIIARRASTNSWVAGSPLEDASDVNIRRGTLYPYAQSPDMTTSCGTEATR
jgi:type II secretory pathway pseudopilin PulG